MVSPEMNGSRSLAVARLQKDFPAGQPEFVELLVESIAVEPKRLSSSIWIWYRILFPSGSDVAKRNIGRSPSGSPRWLSNGRKSTGVPWPPPEPDSEPRAGRLRPMVLL